MINTADQLVGKFHVVEYADGKSSLKEIKNATFLANSHSVIIYVDTVASPYLLSLAEATNIVNTDFSEIKGN